jgi:Ca2+-transporting ATPase
VSPGLSRRRGESHEPATRGAGVDDFGLSSVDAARRLAADGRNELPSQKRRSDGRLAVDILREPMLALLLAAAAVYFFVGDLVDALALLAAALLVVGIAFVQSRRTERALFALRELSAPRALALRDGKPERIPAAEVVRGNVLLVEEGDRVSADGIVIHASNLSVDESLLTGESMAVEKIAVATGRAAAPARDSQLFAGTLVVRGRGRLFVQYTGVATELGAIGQSLQSLRELPSQLQKDTRRAVQWLGGFGLAACIVVVAAALARGEDVATSYMTGIALAMALIPEEFPVVLTVLLTLGAWRLSRRGVLARRITACEALGELNVLCVDKTGTLTLNRLRLVELLRPGEKWSTATLESRDVKSTTALQELLEASILASETTTADPVDIAIGEVEKSLGAGARAQVEDLRERGLVASLDARAMRGKLYRRASGTWLATLKGAPETILPLCDLDAAETQKWLELARTCAAKGQKVLAVAASGSVEAAEWNAGVLPKRFRPLCLLAFEDPVRDGVPEALAQCYDAGIQVLVVSGDHPETVRAVARHVGLRNPEACLTGGEVDALSDSRLLDALRDTHAIARALPHHKLRLVQLFARENLIVGMTGDGINDAPALKAAHVGIALGARGTDVAREAAALVVTDDDFRSIVAGIRGGRRILDNLRRSVTYIVAVHVPIAGLALLAATSGLPLILLPLHIALLELVIDPACSLVFDAERSDGSGTRLHAAASRRLFSVKTVTLGLVQGVAVLVISVAVVLWGQNAGLSTEHLRTLAFVTLVLGNLGVLATNRSWNSSLLVSLRNPNRMFWWLVMLTSVLLVAIVTVPFIRDLLHLHALTLGEWLLGLGLALAVTAALDVVRWGLAGASRGKPTPLSA